jgi:thymidine kinase
VVDASYGLVRGTMHPHPGHSSGSIEVICGPMFSGKTEELIRRLRLAKIARQRVQIFKHDADCRYDDTYLASHSDQRFACEPVARAEGLLEVIKDQTRVIGIDEAQFFDDAIIDVVQKLADRGVRVLVAGLDQDYRGLPFGPMPQLLAIAEFVTKSQAVCMACCGIGTKSQRLTHKEGRVIVGAGELYEARCRACFDPDFQLLADLPKAVEG